jgi:hypothetical protein
MTRPALTPVPADAELPAGPFDVPVDRAGLTTPRIRWAPIDPDKGVPPFEVQCYTPDLVRWEETAAAHKWKANGPANAPFKWMAFLAWAAATRTGILPAGLTWEAFLANTAEAADATTAADTATPTRPGHDPG